MLPNKSKAGRITLLDVAQAAGVSRATASLVIRKSPLVADETRRRVEEAITKLGYVYNMGAASMRATRSNTVGVIIPNLGNPFFAAMLAGIEQALEDAGLIVVLANSRESAAKQETILQRMRERGVDGLILCPVAETRPSLLVKAAEWRLPVVQALRYVSDSKGDYAGTDYAGGMHQAVDHLAAIGHRSIAFAAGGPVHSAYRERLAGFRAAMADRGLDPNAIVDVPLGPAASAASAPALLAHPLRPTAVICFNDIMAGAIANGLDRPRDQGRSRVLRRRLRRPRRGGTGAPAADLGRNLPRRDRRQCRSSPARAPRHARARRPPSHQPDASCHATIDRRAAGGIDTVYAIRIRSI